jgi:transcriptional regulator with XRE-family HTH domain
MSKVAQSHLRGIELGSKQPGIDVLERICESLGLTLADFFNVENQDNQAGMHRLVNAAEKLNPEQLEQLIKFIEVMTIVKRT